MCTTRSICSVDSTMDQVWKKIVSTRMEEDTMTYLKKQIVLWQMTCPCICNSEKMHMPPCQRRDLETTV